MRRTGLLHAELLGLIAGLGHGQTLVIADAGLPVPGDVRRIDLAVRCGLPAFLDVLETVLETGVFEAASVATELADTNPDLAVTVTSQLAQAHIDRVPHEALKQLAAGAVAIVRTGECTPYANVVLRAGVPF